MPPTGREAVVADTVEAVVAVADPAGYGAGGGGGGSFGTAVFNGNGSFAGNTNDPHYAGGAGNAGTDGRAVVLFYTSLLPAATTLPATNISINSATLRGGITPYDLATRYWYEFGATTNFGSTTTTNELPPSLSALRFNGTNQYVNTANAVNLSNVSFTVEAWMRRAASGRDDYFFQQGGVISGNHALTLGYRANNHFTLAFWNNDLDTTTAYTDTNWHHWAGTYDVPSAVRLLYRDGVLVASNTTASAYQGTGVITLGGSPGIPTWFGGDLSEIRVWLGARSAAQIAAGMNSNAFGSESGLLACWHFTEGAGTFAADATTNGDNGTLINSPSWITPVPFDQPVTGLLAGTLYYFHLGAANSAGTNYGATLSFTTTTLSPPTIGNILRLTNGVMQLSFTSAPGSTFSVLGATNVALALSNWTILGTAIEAPPGQFQFIDPGATNIPQRFYRVRSP